MEAPVARVRFVLHNSFAHTYRGHGTDRALVAGILGLATDDERIRGAFDLAAARGLSFEFVQGADDSHLHPNTVDIEMTDDTGASRSVRGESLGGGRIRLSRINGVSVKITGEYDTVFVAHRDARGVLAALTVLLSTYGLNIAFMRTYRTERGGAAYTVFELDDLPRGSQLEALLQALRGHEHVEVATLIRMPGTTRTPDGSELASDFSDARELLTLCEQAATSIGAIARAREEELSGADAAKKTMERVIAAMRAETTEPLEHPARSLGGLIGGEAAFVHQSASRLADWPHGRRADRCRGARHGGARAQRIHGRHRRRAYSRIRRHRAGQRACSRRTSRGG